MWCTPRRPQLTWQQQQRQLRIVPLSGCRLHRRRHHHRCPLCRRCPRPTRFATTSFGRLRSNSNNCSSSRTCSRRHPRPQPRRPSVKAPRRRPLSSYLTTKSQTSRALRTRTQQRQQQQQRQRPTQLVVLRRCSRASSSTRRWCSRSWTSSSTQSSRTASGRPSPPPTPTRPLPQLAAQHRRRRPRRLASRQCSRISFTSSKSRRANTRIRARRVQLSWRAPGRQTPIWSPTGSTRSCGDRLASSTPSATSSSTPRSTQS